MSQGGTSNDRAPVTLPFLTWLQLDLSELLKRGNGLFGSAEQTGSLGVLTIN